MIKNISVVIMAKNAQETLDLTLDSLGSFSEVILYLNNSTDNSEKIAQKYSNVKIIKGEFRGFGNTKNDAGEHSKNDWILSLDSDEIITVKLLEEINKQKLSNPKNIFKLKRNNYFLGYKTQSSDTILRIYNRTFTQFNSNPVHEKVIIPHNANIITLNEPFTHLNITNINQTLTKIIQYTDLGTKDKKTCFFSIVIVKSIFAFFKTYILQGNIIRGWVGFALAINSANKRYYKYIKQFINCQKSKKI
ncbi:MAG TPA: glycosyltransferase family 2 protein [Campylobacterales bacterium]|nr:glycosyltransferase family 2 protein [Campylobacterales bacterium]